MQSSSQIITTNKPTPSFSQAGCHSCHRTNSVKTLKVKITLKGNKQAAQTEKKKEHKFYDAVNWPMYWHNLDERFAPSPRDSSWCVDEVFLVGIVTFSRSASAVTRHGQVQWNDFPAGAIFLCPFSGWRNISQRKKSSRCSRYYSQMTFWHYTTLRPFFRTTRVSCYQKVSILDGGN